MASRFLGYAIFRGVYGEFTIPVYEIDGFRIGNEPLTSYPLSLGQNSYDLAEWNSRRKIAELYPYSTDSTGYDNPFTVDSEPVFGITAYTEDGLGARLLLWADSTEYKVVGLGTGYTGDIEPTLCIFKLNDMEGKYYIWYSRDTPVAGVITFSFPTTYDTSYITMDNIAIQQNPVIIGDNPVSKIVVSPEEQFFYNRVTQEAGYLWSEWCNIYIEYQNGLRRLATLNDFSYSASIESITNLTIDNYDGVNNSFVIKYSRPDVLDNSWFIELKSTENQSVTAKIRMTKIGLISDVYTPGIGDGEGGTGGFQSSVGGGGGNFGIVNGTPETSDPIVPSLPTTGSFEGSVASAGLFVHYAMNANMLEIVGDWLWASDLGLIIAKEFLSILYGSPIESAISLMSYPFNVTALPGVVSNQQELFWGARGAGFNATAITNPYATIDWGTIQLTEFWGNFLDYAPHTKLELYLPWCTGFVPIDPNECLPGTLRVVTNIELVKGTCLHNVIGNDGRVIATHAGTCGKQLPLTALDTSGKALSLVSTAVSMAVAGGAGAAAQSAGIDAANAYRKANPMPMTPSGNAKWQRGMEMAVHSASAPHERRAARAKNMALAGSAAATRTPSHVQRSGSFSGSAAGLGVQFPYLIISRPTQSVPAQYGHHYGYPSNIYTPLSNLRGYTEVGEIHLTGFVCTEEELEEIDSILKGGVIL